MSKGPASLISKSIEKINQRQQHQNVYNEGDPLAGKSKPYGISMREGLYSILSDYSKVTGIPIAKLVEFAVIKELRERKVIR